MTRPGSITLVRHGQPALSRQVRLSAAEYGDWWQRYEVGGLLAGQTPPRALREAAHATEVVIASTRRRAIDTARTLMGDRAFTSDALFIEAPLPPLRWPGWIRLSPKVWGFLTRFWWWWFNHHGGEESQAQAEIRAGAAADRLIALAGSGQNVMLIAHGFFNAMIARELRRRRWRRTLNEGFGYWAAKRFEAPE